MKHQTRLISLSALTVLYFFATVAQQCRYAFKRVPYLAVLHPNVFLPILCGSSNETERKGQFLCSVYIYVQFSLLMIGVSSVSLHIQELLNTLTFQ